MDIDNVLSDLVRLLTNQDVLESRLIGSNVNHTYMVRTDRFNFITKLMTRKPINSTEHNRYLKTEKIYQLLAEHHLPAIEVVHADAKIREFDDITIYGCLILKHIPGEPLNVVWTGWEEEKKLEFITQFAQTLSQIHQITFPTYGQIDPSNQKGYNSWIEYVETLAREEIDKLTERNIFPEILMNEVMKLLISNLDKLDYPSSAKLIHNDLWAANVIIYQDNFYLIDWEWSISGDPVQDLLWIEEVFGGERRYISEFLKHYEFNTEYFEIKKRCLSILASLHTCATGWVFHNPSEAGFKRQEELIRLNMNEI